MDTVRIETAQHVDITYEAAGVGDRVIATLIDAVIQVATLIGTLLVLSAVGAWGSSAYVGVVVLVLLYHPICETLLDGQSPGKRTVRTRVARIDGSRAGVGAYLLRWLIGLVEITTTVGLVALITVLVNRRGQRLGDIAAGTAVVRMRKEVDLADTGFVDAAIPAEPSIPEVVSLSSRDIQIVRDVLQQCRANGRTARTERLLARTKEVVERKMGIPPVEQNPYRFLVHLLVDYNATRTAPAEEARVRDERWS